MFNKYGKKIRNAVILLDLTFLVWVIYHILNVSIPDFDEIFVESVDENSWFAPAIYVYFIVFAELVPIAA